LNNQDQWLSRKSNADSRVESAKETRLIKGEKEVESLAYAFIERAITSSYLRTLTDARIAKDTAPGIAYIGQMFVRNPNLKFQMIADLQKENASYYKALMETGVEIRHIEGNKVNFALSRNEYLAAPLSAVEEQVSTGAAIPKEVVWSTREDVISQADQIFQFMWKSALHAEPRIKQLEEGVEPEGTVVIEDMKKLHDLGKKMTKDCSEEVLMILASEKTKLRYGELFGELASKQQELGLDVRVLTSNLDRSVTELLPNAKWRKMDESIDVSILIYDRRWMLITQYVNAQAGTTGQPVPTSIYSTSKPTIAGLVSIFYGLWGETELRENEERSRKQAQLLQDVLAHDIRNYNQILTFSIDLLGIEEDREKRATILRMMTGAVEGSTSLVDRAKKLGKITSGGKARLGPTNVRESLERSLALVRRANPGKQIEYSCSPVEFDAQAVCDGLLDEVFVNIFTNCVKYAKGNDVSIEVQVDEFEKDGEEEEPHGPVRTTRRQYWRIRVADRGVGVPDETKQKVFTRYLDTAMGSGLGLSIVRALVVGRYGGNVMVKDRVPGNHSEGAVVEVWLRRQS
jgi:signal transduction histidine kinase